jgi:hypothetical protein
MLRELIDRIQVVGAVGFALLNGIVFGWLVLR